MIKLMDLLKENSTSHYDYGCVMLYLDFPLIKTWQKLILKDDIYEESGDSTYGLEDIPHVTLLDGLHSEVTLEQVENALKEIKFSPCKIHNFSIFRNSKYDVMKFDVVGKNLKEANDALKTLPHTNLFPDYKPHMTLAYVKPFIGHLYIPEFRGLQYIIPIKEVVYSTSSGKKYKVNL
jgi:hypothetical protein